MKKFLAAVLALCLVLGMSTAAMAEEKIVTTAEELKNAVDGSNAGDVIKLSEDINWFKTDFDGDSELDTYVLNISDRTLDLNGHKIIAKNFTLVFEGNNFTIQNGTFDAEGGSYALFIGDEGDTDNVIIDNIKLNGGINVYNATNVVLKNVEIVGTNYYAIWCDENGHVTVESGSFSTNGAAMFGLTTNKSELIVSGGEYTANEKPLVLKDEEKWGEPVINAGIFDTEEVKDYITDENIAVATIGNDIYAVGNVDIVKAINNDPDEEVTIIQGNAELTNVPEGVKVTNDGGGVVTVNGKEVPAGVTVEAPAMPVPPAAEPVYRDSVTIEIGVDKAEASNSEKEQNPNTGAPVYLGVSAAVAVVSICGIALSKKK